MPRRWSRICSHRMDFVLQAFVLEDNVQVVLQGQLHVALQSLGEEAISLTPPKEVQYSSTTTSHKHCVHTEHENVAVSGKIVAPVERFNQRGVLSRRDRLEWTTPVSSGSRGQPNPADYSNNLASHAKLHREYTGRTC